MARTHVQVSRSSIANQRPAVGSQPTGSLYVNFPDEQIGVIDTAGNPIDLVPKTPADIGAAPTVHTHTASQITDFAPAVDARLPARLSGASTQSITDWNLAVENGWYRGSSAANAPATGWAYGVVELYNNSTITQTVHMPSGDGAPDTKVWRRSMDAGVWGAWYRLQWSQVEQDARYAPITHTHTAAQITDFAEAVDDRVGALVKAGANVTVTYDDAANTLTIGATGGGTAQLPARLGPLWNNVGDINTALENGWYANWQGANRPNTTYSGWLIHVEAGSTTELTQTAHNYSQSLANTEYWRRGMSGGVWGAWYRLQPSQYEQDARYALKTHTHTAAQITDFSEAVDDRVGALVKGGARITVAYDDAANTLTVNADQQVTRAIDANDASPGLKITQQGAGAALLVEDSTSPDDTPLIINSTGALITGSRNNYNVARPNGFLTSPRVHTISANDPGDATIAATGFSTGNLSPAIAFSRAKSDVAGTMTKVAAGDVLGSIVFNGSNGTDFVRAAVIEAQAGGAPTTVDTVPGALYFYVCESGSTSNFPKEAMRINANRAVAFNGVFGTSGQALLSQGNGAPPVWGVNLVLMEEEIATLKQAKLDLEKSVSDLMARVTTMEATVASSNSTP